MSADLNTALTKLRDSAYPHTGAVVAFLDAIPPGAVLVAITRDDFVGPRHHDFIKADTVMRVSQEAWAALEALEAQS